MGLEDECMDEVFRETHCFETAILAKHYEVDEPSTAQAAPLSHACVRDGESILGRQRRFLGETAAGSGG